MAYPKISVITVVFNAVSTLNETINSVLDQTYPNFEYLIIDGTSTDGTLDIIKKQEARLSYWISEKDEGLFDGMNKGIVASKGDWILFMGSDDVFVNNDVLMEMFNQRPLDHVDFLYGDVILKSRGNLYGGPRNYFELIEKNINHQGTFCRKKVFEEKGLFDLRYRILSDYAFNLALFRDEKIIKMHVPVAISLYNDRGLSYQVIDGNFCRDELEQFVSVEGMSVKDPRLQTYFFFYAYAHLLKGDKKEGLKYLAHALTMGKKKIYYCLVAVKYTLSLTGLFGKIRASLAPGNKLPPGFLKHNK